MKKVLRFLLCYAASLVSLLLIGYGWLMTAVDNEARIVWLFLGSALLLSAVLFLLWETYLHGNEQTQELTARVDELEAEIRRQKNRDQ